MYLLIKQTSKIWYFKYTRPYYKKGTLISFGSYPEVLLQQARKLRDESRELIKQGIDPQEHKAEQGLEEQKQIMLDWWGILSSKPVKIMLHCEVTAI